MINFVSGRFGEDICTREIFVGGEVDDVGCWVVVVCVGRS